MKNARYGAAALAAALFLFGGGPRAADIEAGRQKAERCAECHGPDGNSTDPAVPSIAGQPAQFLSTGLFLYREGNRKHPKMSPVTTNLSNADMNELGAYFSSRKMAPPKHRAALENHAVGPDLTKRFRCVQCHGPALLGQQHIPRLAGQQMEYLRAQLRGFKAGTRADIDGYMTQMAQPLSDKDIEVLVDYLAGLNVGK